jgi:hypothetical protein
MILNIVMQNLVNFSFFFSSTAYAAIAKEVGSA